MEDSRYEAWQKFCEESDRRVAEFNAKPQKRCPFCGEEAEAHWNYDGDYDPHFVIECKSCEAKVKSYRFDEAVKMWNMRIEAAHDREIKALEWKIENYAKVVECKDREIKAKDAKIEELRDCLRIIRDNLLSYTIKSEDGKYVNNGGFLSEEFVDDERWRKALEGSTNEAE